jgi:hypothetical protein
MVYGTVPSWHCQCKNGFRKASAPQNLPFPPPAYSSHALTPHNASLNDVEAGLGLHQLGGRAHQWLARNSKSDAVLDSWLIICFIYKQLLQKGNDCFWADIIAKLHQITLYNDHHLVRFETVLVNSTVLVQYGTA